MNYLFDLDNQLFIALQKFFVANSFWEKIWIFFAQYLIYGLPVLLIILWFWSAPVKKAVFKSVIAAVFAWAVFAKVIASLVERARPVDELPNAKELLFHRPDTSFPSDHATMLFALALSLRLYGLKTLGNIMLIVSAVIVISRVFVGVHFPLDVIAGGVLGCGVAWLFWSLREYLDKIVEPVLKFLKRFYL